MTQFVWNDAKRRSNLAKHGIDFLAATEAFQDPFSIEYRSQAETGEERCILVGQANGRIIAVIYALRAGRIRIVSARAARRKERAIREAMMSSG